MVKLEKEPLRPRPICRKFPLARRGDVDIGKLIGIVIALIILGLFGFGIWWVIKSVGEAGQQYTNVLIDTRHKAMVIQCQTNLQAIWQDLQTYAVSNERFPPSLEALVEWGANPQLLQCQAPDGQRYVYIPGQHGDMPGRNVLVYEPKAVHDGRCSILRLNGQIELLTPEQAQLAVTETRTRLKLSR